MLRHHVNSVVKTYPNIYHFPRHQPPFEGVADCDVILAVVTSEGELAGAYWLNGQRGVDQIRNFLCGEPAHTIHFFRPTVVEPS